MGNVKSNCANVHPLLLPYTTRTIAALETMHGRFVRDGSRYALTRDTFRSLLADIPAKTVYKT